MHRLTTASIALLVLGAAGPVSAQTSRCADIADPTARLVCYDRMSTSGQPPAAPPPRPAPRVIQTPPPAPDPLTVGKDHIPVPPEDRAFDPREQRVRADRGGLVVPPLRRVGSVPVVSGPGSNVPLVTLDANALRPVPGARWALTLTLANNSARDIDARLMCTFRNGNRAVSDVAVLMRNVRPGDQVAADISGPPVTDFVDNVPCRVLSPLE
ncbi:MAG TPA: hypothetical protein VJR58_26075 [Vineibacter sp.]|nr:hypothetical protein [Vineibacter sp.]